MNAELPGLSVLPVTPERVPVGVALVIERAHGRFLMIQRWGKHGQGTWSVPGGWADSGEDPAVSACREVQEEVGLEVKPADLTFFGYTHDLHPEGIEDVCLWFKTSRWRGEPTIGEPDKIKSVTWVDWDDLPQPLFLPFTNALEKELIPTPEIGLLSAVDQYCYQLAGNTYSAVQRWFQHRTRTS